MGSAACTISPLVGFIICLSVFGTAAADDASYRLPTTTRPLSYYVSIATYLHENDFGFFGYVDIRIVAQVRTAEIVLHAESLKDFEIALSDTTNGDKFENLNWRVPDPDRDFLVITLPQNRHLVPGREYLLRISYTGVLSESFDGFYRTNHFDSQNRPVDIVATHLQPVYARRVFPCYDEPAYKANFTVTLTHSNKYEVVSSVPQDGKSIYNPDEDMFITKFKEIEAMSPSSIAFMLSNFMQVKGGGSGNVIAQSVHIASEHFRRDARILLILAKNLLREFEAVLDEKYPLAELHHVILPTNSSEKFADGLGILTYNRMATILSPSDDKSARVRKAHFIAQKIAGQWFGNLVTPKWWNSAWITQSLSTLYSYQILNKLYPDWNITDYYDIYDNAFYGHAFQPLSRKIDTSELIKMNVLDEENYGGVNLLRMLEHALTKDTFDHAVRNFINRFKHSNFDENDFINILQEAATENKIPFFKETGAVAKVFESWSHQIGYPILTVTRNYDTKAITICQEDTLFWVPINFASSIEPSFNETSVEFVLPKANNLTINSASGKLLLGSDEWILLNKQQTGYYVVDYDDRNWMTIAAALNEDAEVIHEANRAQILRDINILLNKRRIEIESVLEVISYLGAETELSVWMSAVQLLGNLNWRLKGTDTHPAFQSFAQRLLSDFYGNLVKIPIPLMNLACDLDMSQCMEVSTAELPNFLFGRRVPTDPEDDVILCNGLKSAKTLDYQLALTKLLEWESPEQKNSLIYGLSCSENINHLKIFLQSILSNEENQTFTSLEQVNAFFYTISHKTGQKFAEKFMAENKKEIVSIFPKNFIHYFDHNIAKRAYDPAQRQRFFGTMLQSLTDLRKLVDGSPATGKTDDELFLIDNEARIAIWLDKYDDAQVENVVISVAVAINWQSLSSIVFILIAFVIIL